MVCPPDSPANASEVSPPPLPDTPSTGGSILLAGHGDHVDQAIDLHILCDYGTADDTAIIVTTTESADQTLATFEAMCPDETRPSLQLVDATSEQQYVAAVYDEIPIVFTPGDLERIVMALSDVTGERPPATGSRHLVVRSLTPLLTETPTETVCTVLERISGLQTENGLGLFGLDYTVHDEEIMEKLADHVDHILWVSRGDNNDIELELQSASEQSRRFTFQNEVQD